MIYVRKPDGTELKAELIGNKIRIGTFGFLKYFKIRYIIR